MNDNELYERALIQIEKMKDAGYNPRRAFNTLKNISPFGTAQFLINVTKSISDGFLELWELDKKATFEYMIIEISEEIPNQSFFNEDVVNHCRKKIGEE